MEKTYLILDFDECLFEHPQGCLSKLTESFALAALELGFPDGLEAARKRCKDTWDRQGHSYHAFEDHGISANALFERAFHIFSEQFLPDYADQISGAAYSPYLKDKRFEVVILSHGSTEYIQSVLSIMGLKDAIPEDRIIGLEKTGLQMKHQSRLGFEMALEKLGLDVENVRIEKPKNLFFVDDTVHNFEIPKSMGIQTVHVGPKHQASQGSLFVDYRFPRLLNFLETFQSSGLVQRLGRKLRL